MSCEIQLTATLDGVSKFLQQDNFEEDGENEVSRNPFLDYKVAISPTGEIIVFARSSFLLICGSKWNSTETEGAKINYSPNWHGHLQCKKGEKITSLLCVPFFSFGQTSHGTDWTCIVVGFSSGCIRFYTEGMQELACIILHLEPAVEIKCFNPTLVQQGKTLKQDNNDIYVLYETVICVFNGPNLSQILLNRRNQLAMGITPQTNEPDGYTTIDFKKYSFCGQEVVTDACFLGQTPMSTNNMFDFLVRKSFTSGFQSHFRYSPPQTSLIITSGKKPFVGFHYTSKEGANNQVLADVAVAVANKIKTSVTTNVLDWFGFSSKNADNKPKEVANDNGEKLNCRFGLCDLRRHGRSIIPSPDGTFSLVTDSLGRVIFIENATGIAQRLWKGFRDAQCAFLQVQEDVKRSRRSKQAVSKSLPPRQGLFVVVYAPKKGVIEILSTQTGRRVGNFKVTKFGHLVYNPRGYLASASSGGFNLSHNQVVFISEEGLTEFLVPFHCALAEESSKLSRDLHILKKMKLLLKTDWNSPKFVDEMVKCSKELKLDEVRFQVIELLTSSRNTTLDAFKEVLKILLEDLRNPERLEPAPKKIMAYAELTDNLLSLHEFLKSINHEHRPPEKTPLDAKSLHEELRMNVGELEALLKFIEHIRRIEGFKGHTGVKVSFEETSTLGNYLSSFDLDAFMNSMELQEKKCGQVTTCRLRLRQVGKENRFGQLSEDVFKGLLGSDGRHLNEWATRVESCCLEPADLALSLLTYWCCQKATDHPTVKEVITFVEVLRVICSLNDPNVVCIEYNTESPWWFRLRSFISASPSTVCGLLAAVCCRSVTIFVEQEKELAHKKGHKKHKSNESGSIFTEWETISKDTCQWDILITQLQDVALLNSILNLKIKSQCGPNALPQVPFDFDYQCLSSIQQKGRGRVSELVAKWLAQFGFEPSMFVSKNDVEFQGFQSEREEKSAEEVKLQLIQELGNVAEETKNNATLPLEYLALLKTRFPYSLTTSSLLSNLSWEYAAYWFKNVKDITYLEAAVRCLEIIPINKVKCGISYLSWCTYLQRKLENLAKMFNRVGRVTVDKLCVQEIGLGNDQISCFLKLICEYLKAMSPVMVEETHDFKANEEAIWQNLVAGPASSLIEIALAQPQVNGDFVMTVVQLTTSLLLMSGLGLKVKKIFTTLFDSVEVSDFTLTRNVQSSSHGHSRAVRDARQEFLQKSITAAVQTVRVVERIHPHPPNTSGDNSILPSTEFHVDEYKKWMQLCFDLANVWDTPLDELRRHQICELYSNGLDRLAEEVIPSVNEREMLASQMLVFAGKRLKYLIQDSNDLSNKMSNLNWFLSEWLKSLDLKNFKHQNETVDDIEEMTRYIISFRPKTNSELNLALDIIESLPFIKSTES